MTTEKEKLEAAKAAEKAFKTALDEAKAATIKAAQVSRKKGEKAYCKLTLETVQPFWKKVEKAAQALEAYNKNNNN